MSTTLNPSDKGASVVLSNGNLTVGSSSATNASVRSVDPIQTTAGAILYCEWVWPTGSNIASSDYNVGIGNASESLANYCGQTNNSCGLGPDTGHIQLNNTTQFTMATFADGDYAGMAFNVTANRIYFNRNGGAWHNSGDPVAGTGGTLMSAVTGTRYLMATVGNTADVETLRATRASWVGTPPTGAVEFGPVKVTCSIAGTATVSPQSGSIFAIAGLATLLASSAIPVFAIAGTSTVSFGSTLQTVPKVAFIDVAGTGNFTVPADFNPNNNYVDCTAAGAGSGWSSNTNPGAGGGGAWSRKYNVNWTPGSSIPYSVPSGGPGGTSAGTAATAGDCWIGNATYASAICGAKGGLGGNSAGGAGGLGGDAASGIGDVKFSGGQGGTGSGGGAGGGGAAGPFGNGLPGGSNPGTGGTGDNGFGGAGGANQTTSAAGNPGSPGVEYGDGLHGSGGGGGGRNAIAAQVGAAGGLYGGGGGSPRNTGSSVGGAGAQGFIAVVYWPVSTFGITGVATVSPRSGSSFGIPGVASTSLQVKALVPVTATIAGVASTSLVGRGLFATVGTITGTSTASFVYAANQGSFTINGTSTFAGVGGAFFNGAFSSVGTSNVSAQGGKNITIFASQGSYGVSGKAAGVPYGRQINALKGTYNYSGFAASLTSNTFDKTLEADTGYYTLTGFNAIPAYGYRINPVSGFYGMAGFASHIYFSSFAQPIWEVAYVPPGDLPYVVPIEDRTFVVPFEERENDGPR